MCCGTAVSNSIASQGLISKIYFVLGSLCCNIALARVFPTSTNANKYVLLAFGSDLTGKDDVEIGGGQSTCFSRFVCVNPCKTNVQ